MRQCGKSNIKSCDNAQKQGVHFDESDRENGQASKIVCDSVEMKCRFSAIMSMDFVPSFQYALNTFCRGIRRRGCSV